MFEVVKSVISGVFDGFASGTGRGRTSCAGRESMREPRAMPRLKVPAPQANRVAARPCPPQESGAGPGRRGAGGTWGPARTLILWGQPMAIRDEYGRDPGNRVVSG